MEEGKVHPREPWGSRGGAATLLDTCEYLRGHALGHV